MSYIKRSLGRSETLLYRAHFPWFYSAAGWTALIALFAAGLAANAVGNPQIAAGRLVAGLVVFATIMLPLWTTEIGVTNQRFIFKRGLIWRSTHERQVRAIEEVNLEQGVV